MTLHEAAGDPAFHGADACRNVCGTYICLILYDAGSISEAEVLKCSSEPPSHSDSWVESINPLLPAYSICVCVCVYVCIYKYKRIKKGYTLQQEGYNIVYAR